MKKIRKYAEISSLMDIKINFSDESFKFNLFKELRVDENTINREIQEQPSSYAFLSMLNVKLKRIAKDKEAEMKKVYATLYTKVKLKIDDETHRPYPKETAKEMTIKSSEYNKAIQVYLQAEEDSGILDACVKSYEQRASLIQTLSANIRKPI